MSKTKDIEDKIASITEENPLTVKESFLGEVFTLYNRYWEDSVDTPAIQ